MLRLTKVRLHRNELEHSLVTVLPWEIPMIEALYGHGFEVLGEVEVDRDLPEPEKEYERLERKYREFRNEAGDYTGETVVGRVWGIGRRGIEQLAAAIEKERERLKKLPKEQKEDRKSAA